MSFNFDVNSNLSRKQVSHYEKNCKRGNFILTVPVFFLQPIVVCMTRHVII
jgi:hypothetical protein